MKKHRIATTISQRHWDLTKQVGKYKTQQKALEIALENLDNSSKQDPVLTDKEQVWLAILRDNLVVLYEKSCFKYLNRRTSDIECQKEFFKREKPVEVSIEFFYKKPLSAMSLKEVLDGLVFNAKLSNWYDTVEYIDEDSHYTLVMLHNLGINCSKTTLLMVESVFDTYGVKTESTISPKSVFVKVFKN